MTVSAPLIPYNGRPCRRGHRAERYASGVCIACRREDSDTEEHRRKSRENGNSRYLAKVMAISPERAARLILRRSLGSAVERAAAAVKANPGLTNDAIARTINVSHETVRVARNLLGLSRRKPKPEVTKPAAPVRVVSEKTLAFQQWRSSRAEV
jgi:hypothetical protein